MVKRRPDVQAEIDALLAFRRGLRNPYGALTGWDTASPSAPSRRLCSPTAQAQLPRRRTLAGPGRASPGHAWALSLAQPPAPQLRRELSQPRASAGRAGPKDPRRALVPVALAPPRLCYCSPPPATDAQDRLTFPSPRPSCTPYSSLPAAALGLCPPPPAPSPPAPSHVMLARPPPNCSR
eukprot:XP_008680911.1 atherin-like [Zea mays]